MYKNRPQKLLFWGLLLVYIQFILLSYFAGRKMKSAFKNLSKMCGRVKAPLFAISSMVRLVDFKRSSAFSALIFCFILTGEIPTVFSNSLDKYRSLILQCFATSVIEYFGVLNIYSMAFSISSENWVLLLTINSCTSSKKVYAFIIKPQSFFGVV